jgi:hypothetical protein
VSREILPVCVVIRIWFRTDVLDGSLSSSAISSSGFCSAKGDRVEGSRVMEVGI